jgi:retron-type reverse transcriptase
LKANIVDKGILIKPKEGVPQGGVISPLLCNLTLNGIEEIIRPGRPKHGTQAHKNLSGC